MNFTFTLSSKCFLNVTVKLYLTNKLANAIRYTTNSTIGDNRVLCLVYKVMFGLSLSVTSWPSY